MGCSDLPPASRNDRAGSSFTPTSNEAMSGVCAPSYCLQQKAGPGAGSFAPAETAYFLVSVVVVSALPLPAGVVTVVDLVVSVVLGGGVVGGVTVVVGLLLAGGAVGASAGFTSTLVEVVGAGVTSVLVEPTPAKARRGVGRDRAFIGRLPSA